jgi:hypothetical protein
MIPTTECSGNSPALVAIPPAWSWSELLSAEPGLAEVADAIASATITGSTYGSILLVLEGYIDDLAEQGRLSPRQADSAYWHLSRMTCDRVEVAL